MKLENPFKYWWRVKELFNSPKFTFHMMKYNRSKLFRLYTSSGTYLHNERFCLCIECPNIRLSLFGYDFIWILDCRNPQITGMYWDGIFTYLFHDKYGGDMYKTVEATAVKDDQTDTIVKLKDQLTIKGILKYQREKVEDFMITPRIADSSYYYQ